MIGETTLTVAKKNRPYSAADVRVVSDTGMVVEGLRESEALRRSFSGPRPQDQASQQTESAGTASSVKRLIGTKAETRFAFIQEKAEFAGEELLDV